LQKWPNAKDRASAFVARQPRIHRIHRIHHICPEPLLPIIAILLVQLNSTYTLQFYLYNATLLSRTLITYNAISYIKEEPTDFEDYPNRPKGLQPSLGLKVPDNFNRDKWEKLTDIIITAFYHVIY
jgi:hypothetical protein